MIIKQSSSSRGGSNLINKVLCAKRERIKLSTEGHSFCQIWIAEYRKSVHYSAAIWFWLFCFRVLVSCRGFNLGSIVYKCACNAVGSVAKEGLFLACFPSIWSDEDHLLCYESVVNYPESSKLCSVRWQKKYWVEPWWGFIRTEYPT